MRQSIATILVAYMGFVLIPYFFGSLAGLLGGAILQSIPFLLVGALGVAMIVRRRELALWLLRGDTDPNAMAPALVRALGLWLIVHAVVDIPQFLMTGRAPAEAKTVMALSAGFGFAKLAIGVFALRMPERFIAVLDSRERPLAEHPMASLIFGIVTVWLLITGLAGLAASAVRVAQEQAHGYQPGSVLWSMAVPELVSNLIVVSLASWAFFGRERLAAAWYRLHPMGKP